MVGIREADAAEVASQGSAGKVARGRSEGALGDGFVRPKKVAILRTPY